MCEFTTGYTQVCDRLFPLAKTPDRREHRLVVSLPKDTGKCGVRNCLRFETAVGGIEPPSPRLTVRRSTTRPPLLTIYDVNRQYLPLSVANSIATVLVTCRLDIVIPVS